MKTISVKLFEFKELTEEIQAKVIKKFTDKKYEWLTLDFFAEDCKNQAKELGFNDIELGYSLSYSQGDGVSFSCKDFELKKFLDENLPENKKMLKAMLLDNLTVILKGNTDRYSYAHKNQVDLYLENYKRKEYKNLDKVVSELLTKLENKYLDLCEEFEKQGYNEIEYQLSEKCIIEDIEANEYTFLENGDTFIE